VTNATQNVATGDCPFAVAVNPVTNKIYVANFYGDNVTVIDGATNETQTVAAGTNPRAVAVNPVTNKIYVANYGSDSVTVIDGATNATQTVAAGTNPRAVVVNPVTNRIYVANEASSSVTVIDGATNSTQTVAVGSGPQDVAADPVTNNIYVANTAGNTVTVIDGATNSTQTAQAGIWPVAVAVNPVTNKIYVANNGSDNVTVIDGATNAVLEGGVAAGSGPRAVAVNPVTGKFYVTNENGDNVTVVVADRDWYTQVVAGVDPVPANVVHEAQPVLTGWGVNRWAPYRTGMMGVLQNSKTLQAALDWTSVTSGAGTDSIAWAWHWGTDSLVMGENFVCYVPLEDQAGITNNLGLGSPCTGNPGVHPLYRLESIVGVEELSRSEGRLTNSPTIVRGVLVLGAVDSRQNTAYRAELLDIAGRSVLELALGENDVRALAPGVYFVRRRDSRGQGFEYSRVTKVVLTR
jgi:YVTN family beta-propeller protein